jgi:UDP-4-amino-4,6-dideoxy-L-N-acetyl-beta-L-altrosamine transaminase
MIPFYPRRLDPDISTLQPDILDDAVRALEEAAAAYLGADHLVAFNSASTAMFAAQFGAGIGQGDEVIASVIAPVAQFDSAVTLGASVRYADIKLDGTLDERFVAKAVTPRTKAILPFHFAGIPSAMEAILKIAEERGLLVIEDATQAFGSRLGKKADLSVFSMEGMLPGDAGSCGFVATQDGAIAEKLRLFRSEGRVEKKFWNYDILSLGFDLRPSGIISVFALQLLHKLEEIVERRKAVIHRYDEHFKRSRLLYTPPSANNALAFYPVSLIPSLYCPKEDIFAALLEKGIKVRVHNKPIYKTTFFKDEQTRLDVAEDFYKAELSLPCHHQMSEANALYVAQSVGDVLERYSYRGCSF